MTSRALTPAGATPAGLTPGAAAASATACSAGRSGRVSLVLALATASAIAFLPGGTGIAAPAAPAPTLAQVQAQADALDLQVDEAVEDYQVAQVALDGLRVKAAAAQAEVKRQQDAVAALQEQVGDVVASAYRNSSATSGLSLLTGSASPQAYLERATSLDQLAAEQADRLGEVTAARARLQSAERLAKADLAAQQKVEQEAEARKTTIEADLASSQALLAGLQAQQRAQVEAARSAEAAAAASSATASRTATAATAVTPTYSGPATGRAAAAVQEAYAKLGSPYSWGSAGPSSFDCSGLTSWVWAKAGVSLPHSSRAQYAATRRVAQSDVQPGDLVFFGSPIHHVGIYIGGGNMISAPHTGDVVKIQPAFRSDYVGAGRP